MLPFFLKNMLNSYKILSIFFVLFHLIVSTGNKSIEKINYHSATFYNGGAPPGYTGSPLDGKTCAISSCHGGNATPVTGWITSNIPSTGYVAGEIYTVSVTATEIDRIKFGFELSPQTSIGEEVGTLIENSETQLRGGGKYITHLNTSTSGTDYRTWTFDWAAPLTQGIGNFAFYAAFNCTNADNSTSGDIVYKSYLDVIEDPAVVVSEDIIDSENFTTVFFDRLSDKLILEFNALFNEEDYTVRVFNLSGELIIEASSQHSQKLVLDVSELNSGVCIVVIKNKQQLILSKSILLSRNF